MEGSEDELFEDRTGQSWLRLFSSLDHVPSAPPPEGRIPPRSLCDVKRIPARDMALFECRPETDPFSTVVCEICGLQVMPLALRRHVEKRHSESSIAALRAKTAKLALTPTKKIKPVETTSLDTGDVSTDSESSHVVCSVCSLAVPSQAFRRHVLKAHGDDTSAKPLLPAAALKLKTAKKSSPSKKSTSKSVSASPPELTEELSKDLKKIKSKKCKSPIPPELEPILPAAGKRTVLTGGPPDLFPADAPKKPIKKKQHVDRKAEKVYDPDKNCGVINETGKPCLRSIFCKVHLVAHKRAVPNRSMPYDTLTKILKSQTCDDRRPPSLEERVPIMEPSPVPTPVEAPPQITLLEVVPTEIWSEPVTVKEEEPVVKRSKTEDVELDLDLPSDLDALIEATLKDVVDNEQLAILPVIPRPEPIVRWSLDAPVSPPTPPPPPPMLADLPWHSTHPRPLATNTFGCRLVGGLMTKSKKLDEFRKHVQSVWGSPASSPEIKPQSGPKSSTASLVKKSIVAAPRRKRKSSGGSSSGGGATPDLITGLLQRAAANAAASAANPPANGVNGVPIRLYNNNMTSSQPAFIQLNLCPSK